MSSLSEQIYTELASPEEVAETLGGVELAGNEERESLPRVRAVGLDELLSKEYPPREWVMEPVIPTQGLAMIFAQRGIGKTHLSLGIAYAVASGGSFLKWQAPRPRGVLFVDGEMPAVTIKERLAGIVLASEKEATAPFRIITPDEQEHGRTPDLSSPLGQIMVDEHITDEIALIVVDNLSTLARTGKENEGESWLSIQEWALKWRARGKSILFIHHAGKGGQQRGTSRREDVLDTVINLRRPSQYSPEEGAVFEVHFEKARGVMGDAVAPFEARMGTPDASGNPWSVRSVEDSTYERVIQLLEEGLSQIEIATELGIHKSRVSRHRKRAITEGRYRESNKPASAKRNKPARDWSEEAEDAD
ncbi:AAA family ATPase [Thermithiobacillus plumbiphilus]|uniref:AAA family ATPase n=1 Tax=Thermithiobacillus plumbiphilus TaxID=1729899 RepID=A0ABU9D8Z7_9PROT